MLRYAITDRTLFPTASSASDPSALATRCAILAREGIDLLLIREKDLPAGTLALLSHQILEAVRAAGTSTRVLLTSRVDIALAVGLDGAHLTSHPAELTPPQIRLLYRNAARPVPAITMSCHTLKQVRTACSFEPTAILFAPVFGKSVAGTQVTPAVGLEALHQACVLASPVPVLALGGVTAGNVQSCLTAGAAGIAAVRFFMTPPDPGEAPK